MNIAQMTRVPFTIAAIAFVCGTAAANLPPVTFISPCDCRDNHGRHRWSVKIDPALPPTGGNAIQAVTPSDIYSWPGSDVRLTQQSERTGIEQNWFSVTGHRSAGDTVGVGQGVGEGVGEGEGEGEGVGVGVASAIFL
jgi:hypothetical protein